MFDITRILRNCDLILTTTLYLRVEATSLFFSLDVLGRAASLALPAVARTVHDGRDEHAASRGNCAFRALTVVASASIGIGWSGCASTNFNPDFFKTPTTEEDFNGSGSLRQQALREAVGLRSMDRLFL